MRVQQSTLGRYIEIRLLRNAEPEDAASDDKITIIPDPNEDDLYEIVFRDALSFVKYNLYLDGSGLDTYLNSLYSMLPRDKDPYRGIQFNIPGFPSVIFSMADLHKSSVREALHNLMPILTDVESERY